MKKQGKGMEITTILMFGTLLVVGGIVGLMYLSPSGGLAGGGGGDVVVPDVFTAETVATRINAFNALNDTGAENVDVTMVCTSTGGDVQVITDTTAPNATNFVKNTKYTCAPVSAANADQGKVVGIRAGSDPTAAEVNDGSFSFTPAFGACAVAVDVNQQGSPQVRVYNNNENAWVCATGKTSTCNLYNSTDGATYGTTTNGTTAIAMNAGDELDLTYTVRATALYKDLNDKGYLVLINASSTIWDEPSVMIDGVTVTNAKSSLNADELKAYADYEYVYIVGQDNAITSVDKLMVDVYMKANTAPGAASDPDIDMVSRGTYRATTNTNIVATGAVTDASSPAAIHTLFDTTINVS